MLDPEEGVGPHGEIVTGVARERVPAAFEPVVAAAVEAVGDAVLYLYGSVATGQALVARSDVDLITVGLSGTAAHEIGAELSHRFRSVCRGVEIGPGRPGDHVGDSAEAYGNRVFLRHYCLQLAGPPRTDLASTFPADVRAARGFNGDVAMRAARWRRDLEAGAEPATISHRMARKSLLAAASLVSVLDGTWTTDRSVAAQRWSQIEPDAAQDMAMLLAWTGADSTATVSQVRRLLDGTVARLVGAVGEQIGFWAYPA